LTIQNIRGYLPQLYQSTVHYALLTYLDFNILIALITPSKGCGRMDTQLTWLAFDWRIKLESELEDGNFTVERAEEICSIITALAGNPSYRRVKQAIKAYLNTYGISSPEREGYYSDLAHIWAIIAPSTRQYQRARVLSLDWRDKYDQLLPDYFNASDRSDIPGMPAHILIRTLKWIKSGRRITKGDFLRYNKPLLARDRREHIEMMEELWLLLIYILKTLPLRLESPDEYLREPLRIRARLATQTAIFNAQTGALDIVRQREAQLIPATADSP
jgi:hypothetical protein